MKAVNEYYAVGYVGATFIAPHEKRLYASLHGSYRAITGPIGLWRPIVREDAVVFYYDDGGSAHPGIYVYRVGSGLRNVHTGNVLQMKATGYGIRAIVDGRAMDWTWEQLGELYR